MAEVLGIITGLYTAGQSLQTFAIQIQKWKRLSERLFDIREGLEFAELSLDSWQNKFDIQAHRPDLHMRILFGKGGQERIMSTLASIHSINRTIKSDINRVRGIPLRVPSVRSGHEDGDNAADEELLRECLWKIQRNTSWSRKFVLSVLGKAEDLEMRIERLHHKLTILERFSDLYLAKEHPDVYSEIRRLPGRRVIIKVGDGRMDITQKKVLDALAARKDAELLHRASGYDRIHIGLSVPQISRQDFAFLLSLNGRTHEVLAAPKTVKAVNDPSRVPKNLATAVSAVINRTHDPCYMMPSSAISIGFHITTPPANLLSDLEHKDPLSTIIRGQNTYLGSQMLYSQDQCAIASGIAQGCFRLIGSQWLSFLDCTNVRWRRTKDGKWTSMLTATPGSLPTTRTLDRCHTANRQRRDDRDLSKHIHIFRIGLVLAELALKSPISYIDFDGTTYTTRLYVNDGEEVDANDIASRVEMRSNVFLGNMVFFCLNVLQDSQAMADKSVEGSYYKDVFKQAEELDRLIKADRRRGGLSPSPLGSGVTTPRSTAGSYVY